MKKIIGFSAFVLIAAVGFFAISAAQPQAEEEGLEVGDTAPDFELMNIDGSMVSLADYETEEGHEDVKGYIVTFTCNTCPYAVAYEDRLIETHENMAPQGWPLIAIQPNDPDVQPGDSMEEMKKRAAEKDFPFVYLMDEGQEVYPQYGANRTPHIFLLDKDRKVHYIGALDDSPRDAEGVTVNYVEAAIAAIESGNEPDPSFTKAIGCTIKTK